MLYLICITNKLLYFKRESLEQFQKSHNRRIQKLIADSPNNLNQIRNEFHISRNISPNFELIEQAPTTLSLLLRFYIIKTKLKIKIVIQLTQFLKLFLYIFNQFKRIFIFRIGILIQFIISPHICSIIVLTLEIKNLTIRQITLRILYNQKRHIRLIKHPTILLIQLSQLHQNKSTLSWCIYSTISTFLYNSFFYYPLTPTLISILPSLIFKL